MPVRHDVGGEMSKLQTMLANSTTVRDRLLRTAAGEARTLVALGFDSETDPNGEPWTPLVKRNGKILQDTRRMANSFTTKPTSNGFAVGSNVSYVVYHQDGTRGVQKEYTHHMVRAYTSDAITAYKLNTKRGRFLARKQAAKLSANKYSMVQVKSMAAVHGVGSGKIPARNMVPTGGQLTEKWRIAIDRACDETMKRIATEAGSK